MHLDVDVIDDAAMPAVDYRMPGGLAPGEVAQVLRAAVASGLAVGLDVTIFNPSLDPDGRLASRLVDMLAEGLAR
jgi:arginase